jgi:hypothetical protein
VDFPFIVADADVLEHRVATVIERVRDNLLPLVGEAGIDLADILAEVDRSLQGLPYGPCLSWTPDSKWLVGSTSTTGQHGGGLHLYSTETGEQQPLTNPPIEEVGDTAPAVSPDGRTLVFSRVSPDFYNVSLWLLHLGEGYKPQGKEERVKPAT